MQRVQVPDSANKNINVSLGGKAYTFYYHYNTLLSQPYLDIYFNAEPVVLDLCLNEGAPLLQKYALEEFDHGELIVLKVRDTDAKVDKGNIGFDKPYELFYISNSELGR